MSSPGSRRHFVPRASILVTALALAACHDAQEKPARQAIAQVEAALADAGVDAARYAPGDLKQVENGLDGLKHHYASGEFDVVLRDAPSVLTQARGLQDRAVSRVREIAQTLQSQWASLATTVPVALEAARHADTGSDDAPAMPAQRLNDSEALWQRAIAQHAAGHLAEAVTLGHQALELAQRSPSSSP